MKLLVAVLKMVVGLSETNEQYLDFVNREAVRGHNRPRY